MGIEWYPSLPALQKDGLAFFCCPCLRPAQMAVSGHAFATLGALHQFAAGNKLHSLPALSSPNRLASHRGPSWAAFRAISDCQVGYAFTALQLPVNGRPNDFVAVLSLGGSEVLATFRRETLCQPR